MSRRARLLFLLGGLAAAAVLGFLLREPVRAFIVLPLLKFFWLLRGYYGSFPQSSYYIVLLVFIVLIGLVSFRLTDWIAGERSAAGRFERGSVSQMAFWLGRARHSLYGRWYVARALADLALDLLGQRGRGGALDLQGSASPPRPEIEEYLQAALRLSPAGFARKETSPQVLSLEENPEPVIAYLETLLEDVHEHFHS